MLSDRENGKEVVRERGQTLCTQQHPLSRLPEPGGGAAFTFTSQMG